MIGGWAPGPGGQRHRRGALLHPERRRDPGDPASHRPAGDGIAARPRPRGRRRGVRDAVRRAGRRRLLRRRIHDAAGARAPGPGPARRVREVGGRGTHPDHPLPWRSGASPGGVGVGSGSSARRGEGRATREVPALRAASRGRAGSWWPRCASAVWCSMRPILPRRPSGTRSRSAHAVIASHSNARALMPGDQPMASLRTTRRAASDRKHPTARARVRPRRRALDARRWALRGRGARHRQPAPRETRVTSVCRLDSRAAVPLQIVDLLTAAVAFEFPQRLGLAGAHSPKADLARYVRDAFSVSSFLKGVDRSGVNDEPALTWKSTRRYALMGA